MDSRVTLSIDPAGPAAQYAKLLPWFAALANRQYAPCNIAFVGDSITEGQGATARAYRWQDMLISRLRQQYPTGGVTGGAGFLPPQIGEPTIPQVAVMTGSPSARPTAGPGGRCYQMTGSDSFTYTVTGTSIDVMYLQGGGTGTMTVKIDAAAPVVVNTNALPTVDGKTARVSLGAAGTHTVTIAVGSGSVCFDGIIVYNGDETTGLRGFDFGHFGWTTGTFNSYNITGADGNTLANCLATVAPQLVVVSLTVNDYATNVPSATTYATQLQSIIDTILAVPSGPCVLLQTYAAPNETGAEPYQNYVNVNYAKAATNPRTVVFDQSLRLPSTATDTFGLYYDFAHPNNKGHALLAEGLAGFLGFSAALPG